MQGSANGFTRLIDEHQVIHKRVGVIIGSTTGAFDVKDPDALVTVQRLIVSGASTMSIDRRYLRPHGSTRSGSSPVRGEIPVHDTKTAVELGSSNVP